MEKIKAYLEAQKAERFEFVGQYNTVICKIEVLNDEIEKLKNSISNINIDKLNSDIAELDEMIAELDERLNPVVEIANEITDGTIIEEVVTQSESVTPEVTNPVA